MRYEMKMEKTGCYICSHEKAMKYYRQFRFSIAKQLEKWQVQKQKFFYFYFVVFWVIS